MSRYALSFFFSSLAFTAQPRGLGSSAAGNNETCVPSSCDRSHDPMAMRCCSNPHVWQCTAESTQAERQISSASKRAAVRSGKDYRDFSELWHAVVLLEPSSAASALFSRHALRAAAAFPAIRFLIVQDAQFSSFGALYSVRGFPSVLLFSDGHLMDRFNERAGLTNFIAAVTGIKPLPECPFAVVPQPMEVSESWDWALVGTSAFLLIDAAAVTHSYLARRRGGG